MKAKKLMTAVASCMAAVVLSFGLATPAHAADSWVAVWDGGDPLGQFSHIDDGDTFKLVDLKADGHGVRAWLFNSNLRQIKTIYNGKGAANYESVSFQYDIKSGTYYYMRVCTVDGASDVTPLKCSSDKVITE